MNTENNESKLRNRSGQAVRDNEETPTQQKWALYVGTECYGFVHACTAQEALDKVSAFRKPFTTRLAEVQD